MEQNQDSERREYFRICSRLPINYGPDTAEGRRMMSMDAQLWEVQTELESAAMGIMEMDSANIQDRPLITLLRWMDFKIDLVLHQLRLAQHQAHFPYTCLATDLSGSGLGISDCSHVDAGEQVLVSMTLPDSPHRAVYAVANVIWVDPDRPGGHARAALVFSEISEADRERLIRYTFRQQRRELARRSEEANRV
jgi:c-di-GMP-binding flagellar brake protein YcgR